MSRFEQTVEVGLRQIADRATPSPDAWDSILTRIADQDPIHETEIIMLTDNTIRTKRWPLFAAAAAVVALLFGGLALINRDDGTEVPADTPTPTVASTPTVAPTTTVAALDDSPSALPAQGSPVQPGRYSVDSLGVPVMFELPASTGSEWVVQVSDDIAITIGHDAGFINMSRVGSFYDAEQAQNSEMTGLGSIPPDHIDAWIEVNDIVVDETAEVTVAGRSAQLRTVRAPAGAGEATDQCPAELRPCLATASASADLQDVYDRASSGLWGEFPHSYWVIELDEFEPLVIWTHNEAPDTQGWIDQVTPLIESIELGEPAPAIEGGTARVPLRFTATSNYDGVRTAAEPLEDGSIPITGSWNLDGDMTGEVTLTGSNFSVPPNGDLGGTTDYVFTGTIDGLGAGTLSFSDEWVTDLRSGGVATTITVTGGAGDLEGATGTAQLSDQQITYEGNDELITGTITFELVMPRSG